MGGGLEQTDLNLGDPKLVPIVDDTFYYVELVSVQVGGLDPILVGSGNPAPGHASNALIDSGTSPILLPDSLRKNVIHDFGQINPQFETAMTQGLVTAAWMDEQDWPSITFTFAGEAGADVELQVDRDHFWQYDTPAAGDVALMLEAVPDSSPAVFGLTFLSMYNTVFDRSADGYGVIVFAQQLLYRLPRNRPRG